MYIVYRTLYNVLEQLFVSCRVTCVKRVTKCPFQSLKSEDYRYRAENETITYITWVLNRRLALLLWNADIPRLDPAARNVIGRLQTRQSQTEVARQVNVHQSTISRLFQRLNQTGQRSAQYIALEVVGHSSLLQPKIGISGYFICYNHFCWYPRFT